MPRVTFRADDKARDAADDEWLYDVAVEAGASIPFSCKAGACGTCATEVLEGADTLGRVTQRELRTLGAANLDPARYRLPCLHSVSGDVVFGRSAQGSQAATTLPVTEAVVESFRRLNLTVAEVRFFVPGSFSFKPGQYVIFQIPTGDGRAVIRRSYSISTPPSDERHFEICVRAVAGGHGSNWVHRLRPGQKVTLEGPIGDFVLQQQSERDIVMVATGTGMSPIKSMLLHLLDQQSTRRVRLFFGVRAVQDLFYTDFLRGLEAHYPSFSSAITMSSPDPAQWAGPRGRVTRLIDEQVRPEDAARSEAYLCGSRAMIEDATAMLRAKGFASDHIHSENFF